VKTKAKIDWDTVQLAPAAPRLVEVALFPRQRPLTQILSGASMKARACGAIYTHAKICRLLDPGLDVFAYGWGLVASAMACDLSLAGDISQSVDLAAYVICEMSARLVASVARA
jgi:hypothetical protein